MDLPISLVILVKLNLYPLSTRQLRLKWVGEKKGCRTTRYRVHFSYRETGLCWPIPGPTSLSSAL